MILTTLLRYLSFPFLRDSDALLQQQEEDGGAAEALLRRVSARRDLLASHTRGQQSEYRLLFRHKHRHHRADRGALQADSIRHSMRECARMARPNEQVKHRGFLICHVILLPRTSADLKFLNVGENKKQNKKKSSLSVSNRNNFFLSRSRDCATATYRIIHDQFIVRTLADDQKSDD